MVKKSRKQRLPYKRIYNKIIPQDELPEDAIAKLITLMSSVKIDKKSQLNAYSISDNNGGRIIL